MIGEISLQRVLTTEDVENISLFLKEKDRESPRVFVGRKQIRDHVTGQVLYLQSKAGPVSCSIVLQGAPGAGKTSLLDQITKDLEDLDDVHVISFEAGDLNFVHTVLRKFLEVDKLKVESLSRSYDRKGSAGFSIPWTNIKIGGSKSSSLPSCYSRVKDNPSELWVVIREELSKQARDAVFVMLVDEAQNVEPDVGSKINRVASAVHQALNTEQLKILPIFAGLSDTAKQLGEVGVARGADGYLPDYVVGSLTQQEAIEVVIDTIKELKIENLFESEDLRELAKILAYASEGWPMHLHHYIHSLISEVFRYGEFQERGIVDLEKVVSDGHDRRIAYYDARLRNLPVDYLEDTLSDIARSFETNGTLSSSILLVKIKTVMVELGVDFSRDPENILSALVHNGVFEISKSGSYRFSIPSFQTYLANDRDEKRAKQVMDETLRTQLG